jgi:glycosyltransferase involved in cell wall biosynthesis
VYPPYGGGLGTVAYNFARALSAEHEVTVFTPRYNRGQTFTNLPKVKVQPLRPWLKWGNAAWLPQLYGSLKKFEVVHLHYPFFGAQELLPYFKSTGKLVVTYHMSPQAPGLKGLFFRGLTSLVDRPLARRADLLMGATGDYVASVGQKHFGQADKWRVLPYGVDESFRPGPARESLVSQLGLKPGEPVLLFVGTLDEAHAFKGLDVLLRSLVSLINRPWRLIVVGGGQLRKSYEAQCHELGLDERVIFTGFVPTAELPDYYRLSSIFVLPSVSQAEAFGLVIVQAMATGLPVIASRLPGLREVVRDNDSGLLVQPAVGESLAAAVDTLLQQPAKARQLGSRGWEIAEAEYRWPAIDEKLRDLYRRLL